jgi:hypothetical protein
MTDQQPTEPTALDKLATLYSEAGYRDSTTRQRAAELLAQHARELAEQTHELAREQNREMRARGDRSRVAYCAGMHAARRAITAYADRLDSGDQS